MSISYLYVHLNHCIPPPHHPSPHSPHCFYTMESPWYIFRAAQTLSLSPSLTPTRPSLPLFHCLFPWCRWPSQPSDHMLCAASAADERSYLLGAHMLGPEWIAGILVTSQDASGLPGWKAVLGEGVMACCCVILLGQACCLRGRILLKVLAPLMDTLVLESIKSLRVKHPTEFDQF